MSTNTLILRGHLGVDPIDRSQDSNGFCTFSIANNKKWTDKKDNSKHEKTRWFNVKCSGKTAEFAVKYLKKGHEIILEGEIDQDSWISEKTGEKNYSVSINAKKIEAISNKKKEAESQNHNANVSYTVDDIEF